MTGTTRREFMQAVGSAGAALAISGSAWAAGDDIVYDSYREYLKASQDYLDTQRQASESIRDWRKKRLAELHAEIRGKGSR